MPSDHDLRAAMEALIAQGDTRTLNEIDEPAVLLDDLRDLLAEHPATPAEPDAGGEGLTEGAKEAQAVPCPYCGHRAIWHHGTRGCGYHGYGEKGCPCACDSDMVIERLLADRERRAAVRALREAADEGPLSTGTDHLWRLRLRDRADRIAGEGQ